MRQIKTLVAAFAMLCFFGAQASATNLSEQQVKDTCGGKIQSAGYSDGTKVFGCDKKCGDTMCTYNCCTGKKCGEQGCHGYAMRLTNGSNVKIPIATYLRFYAHQKR